MDSQDLSLEEAPLHCSQCGKSLCLRKQVINLVLGNTDEMLCLMCLAKDDAQEPIEVLLTAKAYIQGRDCFKKEWQKYKDKSFCPEPNGCFVDGCFAES